MKITFQNPTKGALITVSFDGEAAMVSQAFSLIGANRVVTAASDGLATLRTATQFAEAAPGAAGGGAAGGVGIAGIAGPAMFIGMFFAAGDSPNPTRNPNKPADENETPNSEPHPTLSPDQLRCLADPYNTSAECAAVRSALSTFPTTRTQSESPNAAQAIRSRAPDTALVPLAAHMSTSPTSTSAEPFAWFEPTGRSLVLVNGKDLDIIRQAQMFRDLFGDSTGFSRVTQRGRGSRHLSVLEIALSGKLNLSSITPPKTGSYSVPEDMLQFAADSFESAWADIQSASQTNRSDIHIRDVFRVHPDEDIPKGLKAAAKTIATYNNPKHLTYVVVYTHGNEASLNVGANGESMSHQELLKILDGIPGKKIVIVAACYSGEFVRAVREHPQNADYVAIGSTSEGELGINWQDDIFFSGLNQRLIRAEPVSAIQLRAVATPNSLQLGQTPTIFIGFDTIF